MDCRWQFGLHGYNCRGCWDNDAFPASECWFSVPRKHSQLCLSCSQSDETDQRKYSHYKARDRRANWVAQSDLTGSVGPGSKSEIVSYFTEKFFDLFSQNYIACWNSKLIVRSNFIQNMNSVTHSTHRLLKAEYHRVQPHCWEKSHFN